MEAISTITLLPYTSEERALYVRMIKESVLNGDIDALKFRVHLKQLEAILNELLYDRDITDLTMTEAQKYGSKSFDAQGAKFTITERKDYDFTEDPTYNELTSKINALKAKLKERESILKIISEPLADPETGEMINPATYTTKQVISVSIK